MGISKSSLTLFCGSTGEVVENVAPSWEKTTSSEVCLDPSIQLKMPFCKLPPPNLDGTLMDGIRSLSVFLIGYQIL